MASMLEYLQEMERRKALGMTPGVPYASRYPASSTWAPFQNLRKDMGYYKSNIGDIAASSNPETTKKAGPGRPRLTAEEIQRTASRLGQGTVKALPAFTKFAGPLGVAAEILRSEPAVASTDTSGTPFEFEQSIFNPQPAPSMNVDDPNTEVIETYPNISTIPSFDATSEPTQRDLLEARMDDFLRAETATPETYRTAAEDWMDPAMINTGPAGTQPDLTRPVNPYFQTVAFEDQGEEPNIIPQDANTAVTGQYGLTQNYGGFSPLMGMLVDQVSDPLTKDMLQPYNETSPAGLPLPKYTQTSTSSGFMPPGTGTSTNLGIPYSTLQWENPNTPEMRALEQQQTMMDAFNNSGMTIEEFSATQPSYTPGTGPSTVVGKQYHPGSLDITSDLAGVITHPRDMMINTPTSPADILAAAQVDTFRPVEQLRTDRPRTTTSIFDYLPSFISTASAANTFEDSTYPGYQDYLADEKWHGMGIGNVTTGPGSKDFENWMVSRQTEETPVLPTFNTTMFDDIFTDQTVSPVDTLALKQAYVGPGEGKSRDTQAAANVEKFVDIAAPVQTRRTTPTPVAPVVTPAVTESDEIAMMVRDIIDRNAIRDQVTRDLMAGRDRGEPSHAEVQAAINAMMGNEFGGMLGVGGLGRTMEDVGYGGGFASGRGDTGATGQGGWT